MHCARRFEVLKKNHQKDLPKPLLWHFQAGWWWYVWLRFSWARKSAPCKAPTLWAPARMVVSHPGGFQNTDVQAVYPRAAHAVAFG